MKKNSFKLSILTAIFVFAGCKISVDPELGVDPNSVKAYIVTYVTEMGETPEQIALVRGAKLFSEHLPQLSVSTGYFDFDGWYLDDTKITSGLYTINSNITLTAKWNFNHYEYTETDTSDYVINPSGNSSFSKDGEYLKATVKQTDEQKKKGTVSISNWRLNRQENGINYQLSNVYGFEHKVKCDSNIDWAGMEWFNTSGYNCYYFEVHGDGSFRLRFYDEETKQSETIISLKAEKSNINQNDFNTIALVPTRTSDFTIIINDNTVGTIKREELKIIPGPIAFAATPKKGKTGYAWLKFLSYSQLK